MRIRTLVALTIAAIALAIGAGWYAGSRAHPAAAPAPVTHASPAIHSASDMTDLAFSITWAQTDPAEQGNLCDALTMFGPERAAELMRGDDTTSDLDWDRMAVLLGEACESR